MIVFSYPISFKIISIRNLTLTVYHCQISKYLVYDIYQLKCKLLFFADYHIEKYEVV